MKKFFLASSMIVALLLIGALFFLPYGLGLIFEDQYKQLVKTLPSKAPVKVTVLEYKRGWFSSESVVQIEFLPPEGAGFEKIFSNPLVLRQYIEHGPVFLMPVSSQKQKVVLGEGMVTTYIPTKKMGEIRSILSLKYNADVTGSLTIPKGTISNPDTETSLQTDELSATFESSGQQKNWVINANLPKLNFKTGSSENILENLHFNADLHQNEYGMLLGARTLAVGKLNLGSFDWKAEGVNLQANNSDKKDKIDNQIFLQVQKVYVQNAAYGPQQLILEINQVDAATLQDVIKELDSLDQNKENILASLDKQETLWGKLLSKGLEINLKKLELVTPQGNPVLTASARWLPQTNVQNFKDIMPLGTAKADLIVPDVFLLRFLIEANSYLPMLLINSNSTDPVKMAQDQITDLVAKKWFIPEGSMYRMNMLYQNHQTYVNDTLLPAENMNFTPTSDSD